MITNAEAEFVEVLLILDEKNKDLATRSVLSFKAIKCAEKPNKSKQHLVSNQLFSR